MSLVIQHRVPVSDIPICQTPQFKIFIFIHPKKRLCTCDTLNITMFLILAHLGLVVQVVQSIISLMSLLRSQLIKYFRTLLSNTLIIFVELNILAY